MKTHISQPRALAFAIAMAWAAASACGDTGNRAEPQACSNGFDCAGRTAAGGAIASGIAGQASDEGGAAGGLEGGIGGAGGAAASESGGGAAAGSEAQAGAGGNAGSAGDVGVLPKHSTPVLVVSAGALGATASLYALELGEAAPAVRLLTHAVPPGANVASFSVSPDGSHVAFVVAAVVTAFDVYVVDIDGSNTRKLSPDGLADGMAYLLGWSPSGASLSFQHDGQYYAARVDGSALLQVPSRDLAWTPDETRLVYADNRRVVSCKADGSDAQVLASSTAPLAIEGWSSGGKWLMTASRPATGPAVQAWNRDGSAMLPLPSDHPTQPPLWSPRTEGLFAFIDASGNGLLSSVEGGAKAALGASGVDGLAWSPDGAHLALTGNELVIGSVPPSAATPPLHVQGKSLAQLAPSFQWSPDGQRIAYAATLPGGQNEDVLVQSVDGNAAPAQRVSGAAAKGSSVRSFGWSPDGQFIAYRADHRQLGTDELTITEVASGRHLTVGEIADLNSPRDGISWSRDARLLAFQFASALTVLDTQSFDSRELEALLPAGVQSRAFQFAVRSDR